MGVCGVSISVDAGFATSPDGRLAASASNLGRYDPWRLLPVVAGCRGPGWWQCMAHQQLQESAS